MKTEMETTASNKQKTAISKFCNNEVKVPVFPQDDAAQGEVGERFNRGPNNAINPKDSKSSMPLVELLYYCKCPICMDIMIEVTVTSCGHTFCGSCITQWIEVKPICPICSKETTFKTRLYTHDLLIGKILEEFDHLPDELGLRFYEAVDSRMERQRAENKSATSIIGKIRTQLKDNLLSLKCKGILGTLTSYRSINRISQRWNYNEADDLTGSDLTSRRSSNNLPHYGRKRLLILGTVIGALCTLFFSKFLNGMTFFNYMYLAYLQYDGTIPQYLRGQNMANESLSIEKQAYNVDKKSIAGGILSALYSAVLYWMFGL